ncbi:hypothetical protein JHK82_055293 [Glycine max]|uniref:Uncharacterized protein n=1 Tax=Glycine soja TaxID=3848 RepID=A0A0B2R5W8_GLYSO|nr:hypothetical protein JHK86_055132 [Glycine max]KAG4909257.1 hypothetical protein JHK87_055373 [Glycine soja]KAG4917824.1 hypothetical protein JHK85_056105 [Glycine max]KAG5073924.1 hypothetical protein JHK84_055155 [Glycine max]KAG5076598.1 hypothetical protein JHK82_055293 [Glycine max]
MKVKEEERKRIRQRRVVVGEGRGSPWWRMLGRIEEGGHGIKGKWFKRSTCKKVGNGKVGGVRDGNREQVSLGRRVISRTTGSVVVTTIKLKVDDCWKWMRVADGIYSVSSAYRGLKIPSRGSQVQVNWNGIWNKYTIKGVVVHMEITID